MSYAHEYIYILSVFTIKELLGTVKSVQDWCLFQTSLYALIINRYVRDCLSIFFIFQAEGSDFERIKTVVYLP